MTHAGMFVHISKNKSKLHDMEVLMFLICGRKFVIFMHVFSHTGFLVNQNLSDLCYISNSLANWGSSRASIEAKFHKVSNFLGFVRNFSDRIEKSSKNPSKLALFGSNFNLFEYYSILAEK